MSSAILMSDNAANTELRMHWLRRQTLHLRVYTDHQATDAGCKRRLSGAVQLIMPAWNQEYAVLHILSKAPQCKGRRA